MAQCDLLRSRELPDLHRVFDRAMTPTDLVRILFSGVLRVVDKKVGAIGKFGVLQILPSDLSVASCESARMRCVDTGIHYRCPIGLQPIAKRERCMIQVAGRDFDIVDIEGTVDKIVIADLGSALIDRYGEIGMPHLSGESITQ